MYAKKAIYHKNQIDRTFINLNFWTWANEVPSQLIHGLDTPRWLQLWLYRMGPSKYSHSKESQSDPIINGAQLLSGMLKTKDADTSCVPKALLTNSPMVDPFCSDGLVYCPPFAKGSSTFASFPISCATSPHRPCSGLVFEPRNHSTEWSRQCPNSKPPSMRHL